MFVALPEKKRCTGLTPRCSLTRNNTNKLLCLLEFHISTSARFYSLFVLADVYQYILLIYRGTV